MFNNLHLSDFIFDPNKDKLGNGNFGTVYKVIYKFDKNIYALKIINQNQKNKKQEIEIKREFSIMSSLNHPNIEKVYGGFIEYFPLFNNICYFFLLEFINGENLSNLINRNKENNIPIAQNLVIFIFKGILYGLDYIHKNKILQRDISPDNIMIEKNNNIKITDFGLSVQEENFNKLRSVVGRIDFISPEIFRANNLKQKNTEYDSKSDIFSLGITMFNLMTFGYPNIIKERNLSLNIEYKDSIDSKIYDKNLINLVMSMLENEPNKRPSSEEIIYKLDIIIRNLNNTNNNNITNNNCNKLNILNIDKKSSFSSAIFCLSNIEQIYKYFVENQRNQKNKSLNLDLFSVVKNFCVILKKSKEINSLNNDFINQFIGEISKKIPFIKNGILTPKMVIKIIFNYFLNILPKIFSFNNDKAPRLVFEDKKENFFIKQKINEYQNIYNNKLVYTFYFLVLKRIRCLNCEEIIKQDIDIESGIEFNNEGSLLELLNEYEKEKLSENKENIYISCNNCGMMQENVYETKNIYSAPEVFIFHFDNSVKLDEYLEIKENSGNKNYSLKAIILKVEINNNEIKYDVAIKKGTSWTYYTSNGSYVLTWNDIEKKRNICTAFYSLSSNEFSIFSEIK